MLGAKWDRVRRAWYAPAHLDMALFTRWIQSDQTICRTTEEPLKLEAPDDKTADAVTLAAYMQDAQAIVRNHLSARVWIKAQIAEGALRGNHLYLTLADTDDDGTVIAQAKAIAYSVTHKAWFREFVSTVGQPPSTGMKLLVQVNSQLSSRFGFQLQVHAIDPSFTIGEFARKVAQIRRQLEIEGVRRAQDLLRPPVDFTRVAVISPPTAAGLGDFQREAGELEGLGLTTFTYIPSAFQGADAETELLSALTRLNALHTHEPFDACVILRGGGSQLDLDWLNSLTVARAITQSRVPIFTAIGHERDYVVLDDVSQIRFDTPSKAIGHIISTVRNRAVDAARNLLRIEKALASRIDRARSNVDSAWERTRGGSTRWIGLALGRMQTTYVRVSEAARGRLQHASEDTQLLFSRLGQLALQHIGHLATTASELDRHCVHLARLAMQRTSSNIDAHFQRAHSVSFRIFDRTVHMVTRLFEAGIGVARHRVELCRREVGTNFGGVLSIAQRRIDNVQRSLDLTWHHVDRADPARILSRGFVLVQQDGHTIIHSDDARGEVTLRWADGLRTAHVLAVSEQSSLKSEKGQA